MVYKFCWELRIINKSIKLKVFHIKEFKTSVVPTSIIFKVLLIQIRTFCYFMVDNLWLINNNYDNIDIKLS